MSKRLLLRVSVHERISTAAEDIMLGLETGQAAVEPSTLRILLTQRLTEAAGEIILLVENAVAEYEESLRRSEQVVSRQRKLLDCVLKPTVRLHRADGPLVSQNKENLSSDPLSQSGRRELQHSRKEVEETRFIGLNLDKFLPPLSSEEGENSFDDTRMPKRRLRPRKQRKTSPRKGKRLYPCALCGEKCTTIEKLGVHLKVHKPNRKKGPRSCDYEDLRKMTLNLIRANSGDSLFHCSTCSKPFRFQSMLRRHRCSKGLRHLPNDVWGPVGNASTVRDQPLNGPWDMDVTSMIRGVMSNTKVLEAFKDVGTQPVHIKEEQQEAKITKLRFDGGEGEKLRLPQIHQPWIDRGEASTGDVEGNVDKISVRNNDAEEGTSRSQPSSAKPANPTASDSAKQQSSDDRPLKCPFCSKSFITAFNMKIHVSMHTGQAVF